MNRFTTSITGAWSDAHIEQLLRVQSFDEQPFIIYTDSFQLFGVRFWATRCEMLVRVTGHEIDATTGNVSVSYQPTEEVREVRAEWWRRAAFHLGKHPVRLWQRMVGSVKHTE